LNIEAPINIAILSYVSTCGLQKMKNLRLKTPIDEYLLIKILSATKQLDQCSIHGANCTNATIQFLATNNYPIRDLDIVGSGITEDSLLLFKPDIIARMEQVSLMSSPMNHMDKIIQFIQQCRNLQVLKIRMTSSVNGPNREFFETVMMNCPQLTLLICGGKGDSSVDAPLIQQFIMAEKHLNTFVLDFKPLNLNQDELIKQCRLADRSVVPSIVFPRFFSFHK
jgi:hypothetical protein